MIRRGVALLVLFFLTSSCWAQAPALLQVRVRDVIDADDIFNKLMGDVVEPRRDFIQSNALSVANLDV